MWSSCNGIHLSSFEKHIFGFKAERWRRDKRVHTKYTHFYNSTNDDCNMNSSWPDAVNRSHNMLKLNSHSQLCIERRTDSHKLHTKKREKNGKNKAKPKSHRRKACIDSQSANSCTHTKHIETLGPLTFKHIASHFFRQQRQQKINELCKKAKYNNKRIPK